MYNYIMTDYDTKILDNYAKRLIRYYDSLTKVKTITFIEFIRLQSKINKRLKFISDELGVEYKVKPRKFSFKEMVRFTAIDE